MKCGLLSLPLVTFSQFLWVFVDQVQCRAEGILEWETAPTNLQKGLPHILWLLFLGREISGLVFPSVSTQAGKVSMYC